MNYSKNTHKKYFPKPFFILCVLVAVELLIPMLFVDDTVCQPHSFSFISFFHIVQTEMYSNACVALKLKSSWKKVVKCFIHVFVVSDVVVNGNGLLVFLVRHSLATLSALLSYVNHIYTYFSLFQSIFHLCNRYVPMVLER